MYSYGPPHMAVQMQDDQHEHTFSSYVRIRDVVLKTYLGRWTIGRSGERGSGISVLPVWHDDDDFVVVKMTQLRNFVYKKKTDKPRRRQTGLVLLNTVWMVDESVQDTVLAFFFLHKYLLNDILKDNLLI